MKIFVINCGSSSIKSSFFCFKNGAISCLWNIHFDWKDKEKNPLLIIQDEKGEKKTVEFLSNRMEDILEDLKQRIQEADMIGHRIVHGGKIYKEAVIIDESVKKNIQKFSKLAPLHNQYDFEAIEFFEKHFPKLKQVAVFDTAFHHTMEEKAYVYPGPFEWIQQGIVRYGFHGTSFQYCFRKVSELLESENLKMVICHLGSGASLCAIENGKSVDTTMGFTPLEGLMMDTRSGTVDPGILLYLLQEHKMDIESLSKLLYSQSGLLGLSGISSDMRTIEEKAMQNDPRAKLSIDVYIHRLISQIGAMIATLKGIDALVFTAGIGENSMLVRQKVCTALQFLGAEIDSNLEVDKDMIISSNRSKFKILVIHTQEAEEIALQCTNL